MFPSSMNTLALSLFIAFFISAFQILQVLFYLTVSYTLGDEYVPLFMEAFPGKAMSFLYTFLIMCGIITLIKIRKNT